MSGPDPGTTPPEAPPPTPAWAPGPPSGPSAGARPTGITILAILAAIGGVLSCLGGLVLLLAGGLVGAAGASAGATGALGGLIAIYGLVVLVLGAVSIAVAYGFWTLKPWGYQYGVYLAIANVVLVIVGFLLFGQGIVSTIISIAIWGGVIYYLRTPQVKQAFGVS
jgi:hypothetical protein